VKGLGGVVGAMKLRHPPVLVVGECGFVTVGIDDSGAIQPVRIIAMGGFAIGGAGCFHQVAIGVVGIARDSAKFIGHGHEQPFGVVLIGYFCSGWTGHGEQLILEAVSERQFLTECIC